MFFPTLLGSKIISMETNSLTYIKIIISKQERPPFLSSQHHIPLNCLTFHSRQSSSWQHLYTHYHKNLYNSSFQMKYIGNFSWSVETLRHLGQKHSVLYTNRLLFIFKHSLQTIKRLFPNQNNSFPKHSMFVHLSNGVVCFRSVHVHSINILTFI